MKEHIVYFELFGKKMKTTVIAKDKEQAKKIIRDKIIFHKILDLNSDDFIKDFFKGFGV